MLNQRVDLKAPEASVILTYIYDPSSTSVKTKMASAGRQAAGDKPEDVREAAVLPIWEETSIFERKYRFIEFFIPGVIAMAVMTTSLSAR